MTTGRDALDDALERETYLDDAGFTGRVLALLPRRRRDPRPLVLGLSAAVAAALAALHLPGLARDAPAAWAAAGAGLGLAPAALAAWSAAAGVLLVAGLSLAQDG